MKITNKIYSAYSSHLLTNKPREEVHSMTIKGIFAVPVRRRPYLH